MTIIYFSEISLKNALHISQSDVWYIRWQIFSKLSSKFYSVKPTNKNENTKCFTIESPKTSVNAHESKAYFSKQMEQLLEVKNI